MAANNWRSSFMILLCLLLARACFGQLPQVFNCPGDIERDANLGETSVYVEWTEPTASVGDADAILVFRSHTPAEPLPVGESFVKYVFSSPINPEAKSSCDFRVKISTVDVLSPVVSGCPDDFTAYYPLGAETATASWVEPTAMDDSGAAFLHGKTNNPGDSFYLWTSRHEVTYTFTDAADNIAKCTFYVTFEEVDNQPPSIYDCPQAIQVEIDHSQNGSYVTWDGPSVEDNSGQFDVTQGPYSKGSFFPVGLTSVKTSYTDPAGLTSECSTDVIVQRVDRLPPTVKCPEDITVGVAPGEMRAAVKWSEPKATDDSREVTLRSRSYYSGETFYLNEPKEVEYWFRDSSGNEAMCRFQVSVVEDVQTPRIIGCPSSIERTVSSDVNGVLVDWEDPIAIDNTDHVSLIFKSHDQETPLFGGQYDVIYIFTDSAGNEEECRFEIQINIDPSLPSITDDNTATAPQSNGGSLVLTLSLIVLAVVILLINVAILVLLCKLRTPMGLRTLDSTQTGLHHYVDTSDEKSNTNSKQNQQQASPLPPLPDSNQSYMELAVRTNSEGPYYLQPKN